MKPVGEFWIILFPASIMVYGLELVFKGRDLSDWNCQIFPFLGFLAFLRFRGTRTNGDQS